MNLIKETKKKLEYQKNRIEELQECFNKDISIDAQRYIKDEIVKSESNIEYYSLLLKELEGN